MSIDDLIRDLILEDQFKAKYTLRQRSIFCKNMYSKISKFIKDSIDKSVLMVEMQEEVEATRNDLEYYKNAYEKVKNSRNCPFYRMNYLFRIILYIYCIVHLTNFVIIHLKR